MNGDIATKEGIKISNKRLIGQMLLEAGLITKSQLDVALEDQQQFFKLKIGEILALRGWLKSQTADFLVEIENKKAAKIYKKEYPIGYYLKKAGLLSTQQIENILQEQKQLGIKFCETAILKGYLKEETAEFFLDFLLQDNHGGVDEEDNTIVLSQTEEIIDGRSVKITRITHNESLPEDFYSAETQIAQLPEEDMIITPQEIILISTDEAKCFYYGDIAYSPISIDE
ncbi:hypothetical protein IQ215_09150 [Cyanobacterium stanieri LEGE 03274]|uniref:Type II secretion system protein GspE N-terminal domain-containing protein n=1 Tax=Cyanobacterium stanieri LEGE 03274 TaxID=1828756 RepID=A0ABR9V6Z4_9CHRO|nr:hypothetical protein [Cyanobacterium stanieri]MBE9222861.1 hypothetical protein [Cyanobacterium stanieri LEGE 03274]